MTLLDQIIKIKNFLKFQKFQKFFSSQRSLVMAEQKVRESTVNILSNGSAKILLSYYSGKKDALKLRKEILKFFT